MELLPADPSSMDDVYRLADATERARSPGKLDRPRRRWKPTPLVVGLGERPGRSGRDGGRESGVDLAGRRMASAGRAGPRRRRRAQRHGRAGDRRAGRGRQAAAAAEGHEAAAAAPEAGPAAVPAAGLERLAGGPRGDPLGPGRRDVHLVGHDQEDRQLRLGAGGAPDRRAGGDCRSTPTPTTSRATRPIGDEHANDPREPAMMVRRRGGRRRRRRRRRRDRRRRPGLGRPSATPRVRGAGKGRINEGLEPPRRQDRRPGPLAAEPAPRRTRPPTWAAAARSPATPSSTSRRSASPSTSSPARSSATSRTTRSPSSGSSTSRSRCRTTRRPSSRSSTASPASSRSTSTRTRTRSRPAR